MQIAWRFFLPGDADLIADMAALRRQCVAETGPVQMSIMHPSFSASTRMADYISNARGRSRTSRRIIARRSSPVPRNLTFTPLVAAGWVPVGISVKALPSDSAAIRRFDWIAWSTSGCAATGAALLPALVSGVMSCAGPFPGSACGPGMAGAVLGCSKARWASRNTS